MISENLEQTKDIAKTFLDHVFSKPNQSAATVVALSGDLGAGKTTFTQEIAQLLGIKESVASPTFVIEKIYKTNSTVFTHLIHIDAYRIEDEKELDILGFTEALSRRENLILIEWPEKIETHIPKDSIKVTFEHINEYSRNISFKTPPNLPLSGEGTLKGKYHEKK